MDINKIKDENNLLKRLPPTNCLRTSPVKKVHQKLCNNVTARYQISTIIAPFQKTLPKICTAIEKEVRTIENPFTKKAILHLQGNLTFLSQLGLDSAYDSNEITPPALSSLTEDIQGESFWLPELSDNEAGYIDTMRKIMKQAVGLNDTHEENYAIPQGMHPAYKKACNTLLEKMNSHSLNDQTQDKATKIKRWAELDEEAEYVTSDFIKTDPKEDKNIIILGDYHTAYEDVDTLEDLYSKEVENGKEVIVLFETDYTAEQLSEDLNQYKRQMELFKADGQENDTIYGDERLDTYWAFLNILSEENKKFYDVIDQEADSIEGQYEALIQNFSASVEQDLVDYNGIKECLEKGKETYGISLAHMVYLDTFKQSQRVCYNDLKKTYFEGDEDALKQSLLFFSDTDARKAEIFLQCRASYYRSLAMLREMREKARDNPNKTFIAFIGDTHREHLEALKDKDGKSIFGGQSIMSATVQQEEQKGQSCAFL